MQLKRNEAGQWMSQVSQYAFNTDIIMFWRQNNTIFFFHIKAIFYKKKQCTIAQLSTRRGYSLSWSGFTSSQMITNVSKLQIDAVV